MIIDNFNLAESGRTFLIAELSANHNQDFEIAMKTIKAMKESGADAVKLQTYTADTITLNSRKDCFMINRGTLWDGMNLYELYQKAFTPWEWQPKLKEYAESLGLICFSSPFDFTSVDFLENLNVPAYKIASFEITDIPLIEYIASKGKPVIISTGIATKDDIELAVNTCRNAGNNQIALLKCTSAYPAPFEEMNLKTLPDLASSFDTIVGLSDHTLGSEASLAAVALGAKIIEKHFIIDRSIGGPDSAFSMEPQEFKQMAQSIRNIEKAIGTIFYGLNEKTAGNRQFARSLFASTDISSGEVFTERNIRSVRPSDGLHPKHYKDILGKKAAKDIEFGTPLSWELISD